MKLLITGAKGQLGIDLCHRFQNKHDISSIDIDVLDIGNRDAALRLARSIKPDAIINVAAYTNVDACESDIDNAYRVNAIGARNMAIAALETKSRLLHISTDFIFNGFNRNTPYNEFDIPNPQSVYGKSKLAGEKLIQSIHAQHFIVRTSWLYGKYGNNFVKTMLKMARTRDKIQVVNDQIGTPTYTHDLIDVIDILIKTDAYGLYHCSNEGQCSWNEFARKIFEYTGKNTEVEPISTAQLGRPAHRPPYSVMDKMMLRLGFSYTMRPWDEALDKCIPNLDMY